MALADEERIIREAREDKEKFSVLYEHYVSQIYYFLLSRIHNEDLAEDLTSMTFAKVLEKLHKYNTGNFRAWLYRIANNTMIDYIRKNKRLVNEEDDALEFFANQTPSEELSLDDELDRKMQLNRVKLAIAELPDEYQEILNLRYFSDLSNKEIADSLDCRENNVAVKLHRGLKKLNDILNNA